MALSACINLVLCWCLPSSFCGFRKAVMLIIVCVSFWSSIWPSSEVIGNIFSKCKHCPPFLFAFFFPFKSHWEDWQDWIDFFLWQKLIIGLMILWPTSPCSAVADVPCGCGCAYAKVSLSGMSSSFSNAELHMAFCSVSWQHVLGTRFGGIPLIWAALLYRVRICSFCLAAWESSELNVYNQWLYGSYTVLSCICFREFMNPRQAGELSCCFCSVRERTQHGRDLKSCLWGRAGGSAGRAISHGNAEMLTARSGQPDCARFWSVLLSQKEKSSGWGMVFLYEFIERCWQGSWIPHSPCCLVWLESLQLRRDILRCQHLGAVAMELWQVIVCLGLWRVHITNMPEITAGWRGQACQAGIACPYLAF